MTTITIRIRPDGTVEAVTAGVTGPSCLDYIPLVEQVCGAQVVESRFTEDFYRSPAQEIQSQDASLDQRQQS